MKLIGRAALHKKRGRNILIVLAGATHALEINESFASLWDFFCGREFDVPDVAAFLREEYGLDDSQAQEDAAKVIDLWEKYSLVEKI